MQFSLLLHRGMRAHSLACKFYNNLVWFRKLRCFSVSFSWFLDIVFPPQSLCARHWAQYHLSLWLYSLSSSFLNNNQYWSRHWPKRTEEHSCIKKGEVREFFHWIDLVSVTVLFEFGPEHSNMLSITPRTQQSTLGCSSSPSLWSQFVCCLGLLRLDIVKWMDWSIVWVYLLPRGGITCFWDLCEE